MSNYTSLCCNFFPALLFFGIVLVRRRSAPNRLLRQREFCDDLTKGVPAVRTIAPSKLKRMASVAAVALVAATISVAVAEAGGRGGPGGGGGGPKFSGGRRKIRRVDIN